MEPFLTLTASEVAELLKRSGETVYNLIRKERLPAAKIGNQWRPSENPRSTAGSKSVHIAHPQPCSHDRGVGTLEGTVRNQDEHPEN